MLMRVVQQRRKNWWCERGERCQELYRCLVRRSWDAVHTHPLPYVAARALHSWQQEGSQHIGARMWAGGVILRARGKSGDCFRHLSEMGNRVISGELRRKGEISEFWGKRRKCEIIVWMCIYSFLWMERVYLCVGWQAVRAWGISKWLKMRGVSISRMWSSTGAPLPIQKAAGLGRAFTVQWIPA